MWISAVSATFLENFPAVSLGLGSCFVDFSGFSYFFGGFSGCFAVIRGADISTKYTLDDFKGEGLIIRRGKKKFAKVVAE